MQYAERIIQALKIKHNVPLILFTKNSGKWLEIMAKTHCDVLGVDWTLSLQDARKKAGQQVALQGNMNPEILYQAPDAIRQEVARILKDYGKGSGHIFNLGHGILKDIDPEKVAVLVDAVHTLSQPYHES